MIGLGRVGDIHVVTLYMCCWLWLYHPALLPECQWFRTRVVRYTTRMIRQRTLFRLLLTPSFSSGFFTFFVAAIVLGYSGWLFIQGDAIFYDYLFGAYGLHTFIWQNSVGLSSWYERFLASPLAYYLLVGGVALGVGVVIFTVLQAIGVIKSGARHLFEEAGSQEPIHRRAARELLLRLGLRIVSFVSWVVFIGFFVSSIMPFTIVLNQIGIRQWAEENHPLTGLFLSFLALLLFVLSLHVQIIFARLCLLRSRLFHANVVVEEAEAHEL